MAGGVSCNGFFQVMMKDTAKEFNLPLISNTPSLATDNASMIAWMGWELINAQQDVDVRNRRLNGLAKIPLGNYVEGLYITSNA